MKGDKAKFKNNILRNVILVAFILLFVLIQLFQYYVNFDVRKQPPSAKWSKEVLLSSGDVRTTPKVLKLDNKYIVAHDDGNKIKVIITDMSGKKLSETSFDAGAPIVKTINLLTDDSDIYLNWTINNNEFDIMNTIKLDKSLNQLEKSSAEKVVENSQINDNVMLVSYSDKIEYLNIKTGKKITTTIPQPIMISGTTTDRGYLITYLDTSSKYNYFFINNDVASSIVTTTVESSRDVLRYENYAMTSDGKNCYIIKQYKSSGSLEPKTQAVTFSLDGKSAQSLVTVDMSELWSLDNLIAINSDKDMNLLCTTTRPYGKKSAQDDIIQFKIVNGAVTNTTFVSRTNALSIFPYSNKDAAVFCDFIKQDYFGVYLTSQNENFKNAVNGVRSSEKSDALLETIEFLGTSIGMLFIQGLVWIIPGLVLISVFSFFTWALKSRTKIILYSLVYIATSCIKNYFIYSKTYFHSTPDMFPNLLASTNIGMAVCILFSLLGFMYGLKRYVEDLDNMPAISFFSSLIMDSLLSLTLFYPFMH